MRAGLFSQPAQVSSPGVATFGNERVQRMCREEDRECQGKTRGEKFAASVIRGGLCGCYLLSRTLHTGSVRLPENDGFVAGATGEIYSAWGASPDVDAPTRLAARTDGHMDAIRRASLLWLPLFGA